MVDAGVRGPPPFRPTARPPSLAEAGGVPLDAFIAEHGRGRSVYAAPTCIKGIIL